MTRARIAIREAGGSELRVMRQVGSHRRCFADRRARGSGVAGSRVEVRPWA